jgi:hypothetical protein
MDDIKKAYLEAARAVFGWAFAPMEQVPYDQLENRLGLAPDLESDPLG